MTNDPLPQFNLPVPSFSPFSSQLPSELVETLQRNINHSGQPLDRIRHMIDNHSYGLNNYPDWP